ncbi:UDP-4-amino-4,6-dideoxy-N-acetyl-beta-L-altrosamine transaminase [candidate division WOR-3 bacterium JGI_Cruoil_03_44_89]|uniref:UDP-4-amino-4, 6-dideoxy-N-acetyl-beta-L-altrosamine transaminase n=1 Tax=candidate division WOR-3 bacterium JGI_Cruoil_03_44_89 TaxID=1973748 RepID=A0A235BZF9_UNCW3|nr:MAG: UDP-4-amino-4,6-dideoxy-N-acetyl-beta-L-altrosamine transaminase [candidate division WOR-3 bacterium JGI_Cruoil_03_44_89]
MSEIPAIAGGTPVRNSLLSFAPPLIEKEEIKEVVDTLKSGWITTGPKTKRFERMFSEYVSSKYAVALSSCTAGLHLALLAIGVSEGDEIITTPYTFAATSNVIIHSSAIPVFVDIDEESLNINHNKIEEKITERTKAIMPVHIGGRPCDMDKIMEIARRHNLYVIEDAAHAVGTIYKETKIGSIGDLTSFSFHAVKNMTTAEGGMITTDNEEWARFIRVNSLHGMNKDAWQRKGSWFYEIVSAGYKYNMTDIQASIGIHQLEKIERFIELRKKYASIYTEKLGDIEEIETLSPYEYGRNTYHLYVIKIKPDRMRITRDKFIRALREENISTNVHYIPIHLHPYYRERFGYKKGDYPSAERVYERAISLPIYPAMKEKDVLDVINAIEKIVVYYGGQNV